MRFEEINIDRDHFTAESIHIHSMATVNTLNSRRHNPTL